MKAAEYVESLETTKPELPGHKPSTSHSVETATLETDAADIEFDDDVIFEPVEFGPVKLLGLVELILKNRSRMHIMLREPSLKSELIPRFLAISLIGFLFFGVAMSVVLSSTGSWPELTAIKDYLDGQHGALIDFPNLNSTGPTTSDSQSTLADNPWLNGAAAKLILAYSLGLIAATGICLPSLYFYGLLAGIKMSMLDVTIHALKSKATAAVALVGILPIYAAISMGMVIFGAPASLLKFTLILGLILPFIAGFWGTASLYVGFASLCDTLPLERRHRRECFLRRLVLSWSACYTAIMPIMIFTLWQSMGG